MSLPEDYKRPPTCENCRRSIFSLVPLLGLNGSNSGWICMEYQRAISADGLCSNYKGTA